jgi:hypothetical protein
MAAYLYMGGVRAVLEHYHVHQKKLDLQKKDGKYRLFYEYTSTLPRQQPGATLQAGQYAVLLFRTPSNGKWAFKGFRILEFDNNHIKFSHVVFGNFQATLLDGIYNLPIDSIPRKFGYDGIVSIFVDTIFVDTIFVDTTSAKRGRNNTEEERNNTKRQKTNIVIEDFRIRIVPNISNIIGISTNHAPSYQRLAGGIIIHIEQKKNSNGKLHAHAFKKNMNGKTIGFNNNIIKKLQRITDFGNDDFHYIYKGDIVHPIPTRLAISCKVSTSEHLMPWIIVDNVRIDRNYKVEKTKETKVLTARHFAEHEYITRLTGQVRSARSTSGWQWNMAIKPGGRHVQTNKHVLNITRKSLPNNLIQSVTHHSYDGIWRWPAMFAHYIRDFKDIRGIGATPNTRVLENEGWVQALTEIPEGKELLLDWEKVPGYVTESRLLRVPRRFYQAIQYVLNPNRKNQINENTIAHVPQRRLEKRLEYTT